MDCAQLSSEGDLADVRILAEVVLVIHLVQVENMLKCWAEGGCAHVSMADWGL